MSQENPAPPTPLASSEVPWQVWSDVPRYAVRYRHLSLAALGEGYHVGVAIEELPPGMQSSPAHWHVFEEEHLRSEEHTSELQSLMRISYAVFRLKKKNNNKA